MKGFARLHPRLFKSLLTGVLLFLWVALSFGLAALLFYLGEEPVYPLGPNYEYLDLQIALYHLRPCEGPGDYTILGEDHLWHYYQIIPVSERLPHAFWALFRMQLSYATCMDNLPLLTVFSVGLRHSLIALGFFALASLLAFPFRFFPGFKVPRFLVPLLGCPLILIAFLSPLWSSSLGWTIPFLASAIFLLSLWDAGKKDSIKRQLSRSFLHIGIAWFLFHVIGTYSGLDQNGYSLSSLLLQAIKGKDNHTYALIALFLMVLSALPFAISFLLAGKKPQKEEEAKESR